MKEHPEWIELSRDWTEAWKIIAQFLKELGVSGIDHNAKAILARLAHSHLLLVRMGAAVDVVGVCQDVTRIAELCEVENDRRDLQQLLPLLLERDPEEQEAAIRAIVEVTSRKGGRVIPL